MRYSELPCGSGAKKHMIKTNSLIAILLGSLVLLIPAGRGMAQKQRTAQATIPFEFWIAGSRLPAGEYRIEHVESTTYILFRSTDGKTVMDAYTLPLDENPVKDSDAKLVFRIQNGKHYLYEGWGQYGRRVVTVEYGRPVPSGDNRAEVPVIYH